MAAVWDDEMCLRALHAVDVEGVSRAVVARRMGVSRSAVIGILHRINAETDAVLEKCKKPENRDGGMPDKWWQAGLRRRRA